MTDDNSLRELFSKNLNKYLERREMSQNELARRIGVSSAAVNKWAKGETMPRRGKSTPYVMCSKYSAAIFSRSQPLLAGFLLAFAYRLSER